MCDPLSSPESEIIDGGADAVMVAEPQTFSIRYGTAFTVCEFGFVGKGEIAIHDTEVILSGNKQWSKPALYLVFLTIATVLFLVFGCGILLLVPLAIEGTLIHYFCASPGQVTISRSRGAIAGIRRRGRTVSFLARAPNELQIRKTLFKPKDEEQARMIVAALSEGL